MSEKQHPMRLVAPRCLWSFSHNWRVIKLWLTARWGQSLRVGTSSVLWRGFHTLGHAVSLIDCSPIIRPRRELAPAGWRAADQRSSSDSDTQCQASCCSSDGWCRWHWWRPWFGFRRENLERSSRYFCACFVGFNFLPVLNKVSLTFNRLFTETVWLPGQQCHQCDLFIWQPCLICKGVWLDGLCQLALNADFSAELTDWQSHDSVAYLMKVSFNLSFHLMDALKQGWVLTDESHIFNATFTR